VKKSSRSHEQLAVKESSPSREHLDLNEPSDDSVDAHESTLEVQSVPSRAGAGSLGRLLLLELSSLTPKSVRLLAMFIGGSKDARSACGQRACRISSHSAFAGDRTARHIMRAQGAALSM